MKFHTIFIVIIKKKLAQKAWITNDIKLSKIKMRNLS